MPRTSGVYSLPAGSKAIPDTTVRSAPYNAVLDDLASDANNARPITAGGTGATNATKARENLGALAEADVLAAATKTTPIDADGIVITDSADEGKLKRVLWSRIKVALKAYFDGLYLGLGGGTLTGELITRSNADGRILLPGQGAHPDLQLNYSGAGNAGLYKTNGTGWLMSISPTGVMGSVTIPTSLLSGTLPSARFQNMIYGGDASPWFQINGRNDGDQSIGMSIRVSTGQDFYLTYNNSQIAQISTNGSASFNGAISAGGSITFTTGDGRLGADGYLQGSYWGGFGDVNARACIWARIEDRGAAYPDAAEARAVARCTPLPSTSTSTANVNFPIGSVVGLAGGPDSRRVVTPIYKAGTASGGYGTNPIGAEHRLTGTWICCGAGIYQRVA